MKLNEILAFILGVTVLTGCSKGAAVEERQTSNPQAIQTVEEQPLVESTVIHSTEEQSSTSTNDVVGKIKGDTLTKIYHEPSDAYYNHNNIQGVDWFNTVEEAEAAGYISIEEAKATGKSVIGNAARSGF